MSLKQFSCMDSHYPIFTSHENMRITCTFITYVPLTRVQNQNIILPEIVVNTRDVTQTIHFILDGLMC